MALQYTGHAGTQFIIMRIDSACMRDVCTPRVFGIIVEASSGAYRAGAVSPPWVKNCRKDRECSLNILVLSWLRNHPPEHVPSSSNGARRNGPRHAAAASRRQARCSRRRFPRVCLSPCVFFNENHPKLTRLDVAICSEGCRLL